MVNCAVYGCKTTQKNKTERVKLYRFPKDSILEQQWVNACKKNNINVKCARICSLHFPADAFQKPLIQTLLGYSPATFRNLKADAVPTENLPDISKESFAEKFQKRKGGALLIETQENAEITETIAEITATEGVISEDIQQTSQITSLNSFDAKWRAEAGILCRLCVKSDVSCVPIFRGKGLEMKLEEKIEAYLQLQISNGDNLPDQVCMSCSNAIMAWSEFAENCSAAQTKLVELLNAQDEDSVLIKRNLKQKKTVIGTPTSYPAAKSKSDCGTESNLLWSGCLKVETPDVDIYEEDVYTDTNDSDEEMRETNTNDSDSEVLDAHTNNTLNVPDTDSEVLEARTNNVLSVPDTDTNEADDETNMLFLKELFNSTSFENSKDNEVSQTTKSVPKNASIQNVEGNKKHKCNVCRTKFPSFLLWASHTMAAHPKKREGKINNEIGMFSANHNKNSSLPQKQVPVVKASQSQSISRPAKTYFKCNVCFTRFSSSLSLSSHVMAAHSKKKYFCTYCTEEFDDEVSLKSHKLVKHIRILSDLPRNRYCPVCKQKFLKSEFRRHLNSHPNLCMVCYKTFENPQEYEEHKKCHSQGHLCELCGKTLATRSSYTTHLQTHVPVDQQPTYECAECELTYKNKSAIRRHIVLTHSEEKQIICELCGKILGKGSYKSHIEGVHSQVYSHPCDICGRKFKRKTHLNNHKKTHFNRLNKSIDVDKQIQCKKCTRAFTTRTGMLHHLKTHNSNCPSVNSVNFVCSTCNRVCKNALTYKQHLLLHKVNKPFKCKFCDRSFATKIYRDTHEFNHTGERPFQCRICDKRFTSKTLCKSHSDIHINLRPYACKYCDKRFRRKSYLDTHIRIHTNDKRYQCSICLRSFIQSNDAKKHMKTHTNLDTMCEVVVCKENLCDTSQTSWEIVIEEDTEV